MGRLFGTNGVRGVVNEDLTLDLATRLGQSLGTWLRKGTRVAIGMDARTSSPMFADAVASGLMSAGASIVRLGVAPSPSIQFYVRQHPELAAGVIITASHNPPEFNGIKFIARDGTEMSSKDEDAIEAIVFGKKFKPVAWNAVGAPADDPNANVDYRKAILARVDVKAVRAARLKVVIDTAGGAGGVTSPPLLRDLGCQVTALHEPLDGTFSGRLSETTEKNLGKLIETVRRTGADLGVAHDGDADRCVFIDDQARYVSGDKSMALLAGDIVRRNGGGLVCTPVSTSSLVREVVEAAGGKLVTTAVGSPIVAREMMRRKCVFGGEENGGLLFPDLQLCRDGAMTLAQMLDFLVRTKRPMSQLIDELPKYHVHKRSLPCPNGAKKKVLARLAAHYKKAKGVRIDTTDGLKIYRADGSWVLIRPSGTEPIYRVFAESRDGRRAQDLAAEAVKLATSLVRASR